MRSHQTLDLRTVSAHMSSEPSFRQSPPNLKEMLSHSSTHNLWLVMHSQVPVSPRLGTLPSLDSLPLPALLSPRPTTTISSFTARENMRLESRLGSSHCRSIETPRNVEISLSPLPSDLDYKRAIEKLNRIAAHGGSSSHKLVLGDRKPPAEIMLDAEEWLYVKVDTKGKPVPLRLNVRKIKGRVVTYVSKTVQEPSELQCEFVSHSDNVVIRDNSVRFHANYVFLGIFAAEDSVISLRTQFGKAKIVPKLLSGRCEDMDDCDLLALLPSPRPKSIKFCRNFLQENKQKAVTSPWWSGAGEKREQRVIRQQAAKQRFREQITLKRSKALAMLNRGETRRQEREKQAQILAERLATQDCERLWLTLVSVALASESLWKQFEHKKGLIQVENLKHKFAEKIQNSFRNTLGGLNMSKFLMLRAGQGLRLLVHLTALIDAEETKRKVGKCIVLAGRNARVKVEFTDFWMKSKIYAVKFIQQHWREAVNRKRTLFDKLQLLWSQAFSAVTEPLTRKKTTRKGKQTLDLAVKRYFSISAATRLAVLQQYYNSEVQAFLVLLRSHLADRKFGARSACPKLDIEPTTETMKELVEKAAERSEKLLLDD